MTAKELLRKQIDDVSYQLEKVLEGVSDSDLDFKLAPTVMTAREHVVHLCEVYTAVEEGSRGVEHAWGTYDVADRSWTQLKPLFESLRARAVEIVTSSDDDKSLLSGTGFIVNHDSYHVGQLSSIRIALDSTWDPSCIYAH